MKHANKKMQLGLWISCMAFLVLLLTKDKATIVCSGAAALAITILNIGFPKISVEIRKHITRFSVLAGTCINAVMARKFYLVWYDSEKIDAVTQRIGLSGKSFIWILSICGAIAAIPALAGLIGMIVEKKEARPDEEEKTFLDSRAFCAFGLAFSIIGIGAQIVFSFSRDIWGDESFSLMLVRHGYLEMIELTAADVHPPLYYIILKICIDGAHLLSSSIETVYLAKLVSVIPFLLILLFCVTKIHKRWGNYVAGISMICLVGMPNLIAYGVKIRMYSWGLFFVTGAFVCFTDILLEKDNDIKAWIGLVLYSLSAAYTHYFACVSVALLYLILFLRVLVVQKGNMKRWLIAFGATIVLYMPWLFILFKQLQKVSESYWIAQIDMNSFKSYVYYIWGNKWLLAVCAICVLLLVKNLFDKSEKIDENIVAAFTAFLIPIWTIAVGVFASVAIRPVFVTRYMIPGLFCLWTGTALIVWLGKNKVTKVIYTAAIVLVSIEQVAGFVQTQYVNRNQTNEVLNFISDNKDAIFLCDDSAIQRVLVTQSAVNSYYIENTHQDVYYDVYGKENLPSLTFADKQVSELLNEGKTIYLFESQETKDQKYIWKDLKSQKIGCYWFGGPIEIYRMELSK